MKIGSISAAVLIVSLVAAHIPKFQKCVCIVHDELMIKVLKCATKPYNRTATLVNMAGVLLQTVYSAEVNLQLYRKAEIVYRPFLVNITENYCDFFAKNQGSRIWKLIAPLYLPYTNLNHTCPYSGYVFIENFLLQGRDFPPSLMNGHYRLDVLIMENGHKIITLQLFSELR